MQTDTSPKKIGAQHRMSFGERVFKQGDLTATRQDGEIWAVPDAGEDREQLGFNSWLVGSQNRAAKLHPAKPAVGSGSRAPWLYPKGPTRKNLHTDAYSSFIHNCSPQNLETTKTLFMVKNE